MRMMIMMTTEALISLVRLAKMSQVLGNRPMISILVMTRLLKLRKLRTNLDSSKNKEETRVEQLTMSWEWRVPSKSLYRTTNNTMTTMITKTCLSRSQSKPLERSTREIRIKTRGRCRWTRTWGTKNLM